jgi:hypothetical protein
MNDGETCRGVQRKAERLASLRAWYSVGSQPRRSTRGWNLSALSRRSIVFSATISGFCRCNLLRRMSPVMALRDISHERNNQSLLGPSGHHRLSAQMVTSPEASPDLVI